MLNNYYGGTGRAPAEGAAGRLNRQAGTYNIIPQQTVCYAGISHQTADKKVCI
jgi:hypothetical protein